MLLGRRSASLPLPVPQPAAVLLTGPQLRNSILLHSAEVSQNRVCNSSILGSEPSSIADLKKEVVKLKLKLQVDEIVPSISGIWDPTEMEKGPQISTYSGHATKPLAQIAGHSLNLGHMIAQCQDGDNRR